MEIFKNIYIQKGQNSLAFLIEEALEEKAPFAESGQNALQLEKILMKDLQIQLPKK